MSAVSGINALNSSSFSNMYSLLSYGSTASAAASRVNMVQKISSYDGMSKNASAINQGRAESAASASVSRNTVNNFLSMYRGELIDLKDSASKLETSASDSVWNQTELGAEDEEVVRVSGNSGASSGREFTIDVQSLAGEGQEARFSITENGVTTEYSGNSNNFSLENGGLNINLKAVGTTNVYSGIDGDKVTNALKGMIENYNTVQDTISKSRNVGSAMQAQYQSMNISALDNYTLDKLGISYDEKGLMALDEDKFKAQLESNYEQTKDLLGGTTGAAARIRERAESALSDSVNALVDNVSVSEDSTRNLLSGLSGNSSQSSSPSDSLTEAYGMSAFQYLSNISKGGAYNFSNYYTTGLLLNTLA